MNTTTHYTCDNHRPFPADDQHTMREAAREFAARKARAEFGRRGTVGAIRQDSHAPDGSFATYEAFIGTPSRYKHEQGSITGHNVRFTVHTEHA